MGLTLDSHGAVNQNIEITLDTHLESVDIAEQVAVRAAEASGFDEDDVHKIGMAVREGMINAYNYGNRQDHSKKIMMTIELKAEKMIIHVLDQGEGFDLADSTRSAGRREPAAHVRARHFPDARVHGRTRGAKRAARRR